MTKVDMELAKALREIGDIRPWPEEGGYFFVHDLYPAVMYMADTPEATVEGYRYALREFIIERLANNVSEAAERITSGRGGKREGAGRPKGTAKQPTKTIRLPVALADWLKSDPSHIQALETLMHTQG